MGQAKQRGSFEKRKATAIELQNALLLEKRTKEEQLRKQKQKEFEVLSEEEKEKRKKDRLKLQRLAAAAIFASAVSLNR